MGIEPTFMAWEAIVLPMNYARVTYYSIISQNIHPCKFFLTTRPPEILFIERCTQFLKPGGRMGIVLPESTTILTIWWTLVPLLKNKEAQAKINSLALLANEKRYEAYLKEQEAIACYNVDKNTRLCI